MLFGLLMGLWTSKLSASLAGAESAVRYDFVNRRISGG